MSKERLHILITGQVQGVGFRPHIYRIANHLKLSGWIQNNGKGVTIEIQGDKLYHFISQLTVNLPPLAKIDSIQTEIIPIQNEVKFAIRGSEAESINTIISPDVGTCTECLKELFDPNSRYYRYPFLNCTNCGPRLTITRNLPYDRVQTSMVEFPLCEGCQKDYEDPLNRRFHAQPTACNQCGPKLSLSLMEIMQRIAAGEIVAIKGLGGYQIVCDARNKEAVIKLRQRKQRKAKPFAIMCANIKSAKTFTELSNEEEDLLTSWMRPIVLLRKSYQNTLPEEIAPSLSHLGVMLPCTPMHYLLFNHFAGSPDGCEWLVDFQSTILIVSSANPGATPLLIDDTAAQAELKNIADTIVSYNRAIVTRADDSVLRVVDSKPLFIRRARGFVPSPIKLAYDIPPTLALGGYLKNTFCITRADEAFVSQHIGDLKNKATITFFHETLNYMLNFLGVKPERIAHDLHPDFYTTHLAQEFGLPIFPIQHHHAHLASVAAEHCVDEPALGLALDGYGHGENGEAWGGELGILQGTNFQRLGCLQPLPLPGGDKAAYEPWRMAVAVLHVLGLDDLIYRRYSDQPNLGVMLEMLRKSLHCPLTTSCGRLFDAASALLGIQPISHYEGHAAMCLESLVTEPQILPEGWLIQGNRFNLLPTLEYLLGCNASEGANVFHGTLVAGLAEWLSENARRMNVTKILLSGGCFLNQVLAEGLVKALAEKNLIPLLPQALPPNDGGISLGQAWIAGRKNLCA